MSAFRSNRDRKPYNRPENNDAGGRWLHDKAPGGPERERRGGGGGREGLGLGSAAPPNTRLTVSNLHYEITPQDLTSIFGQVGTLVKEPMIRYDRSGRSTGKATITYETTAEAAKAKKQFDGLLAKGEPMSIVFDTAISKRSSSAPTSLLNRIQKPALSERITSSDDIDTKTSSGGGPIRSSRGGRRGGRGGSSGGGRQAPKKPKTAEDLDKELDAFMVPDAAAATSAESAAAAPAAGDVEMAT